MKINNINFLKNLQPAIIDKITGGYQVVIW